jgi:hypothetical protein
MLLLHVVVDWECMPMLHSRYLHIAASTLCSFVRSFPWSGLYPLYYNIRFLSFDCYLFNVVIVVGCVKQQQPQLWYCVAAGWRCERTSVTRNSRAVWKEAVTSQQSHECSSNDWRTKKSWERHRVQRQVTQKTNNKTEEIYKSLKKITAWGQ